MTGLKDLISAIRRLFNLTKGDINIIHLPTGRCRHIDGMIAGQIILSVLSQDQLNLIGRILLVKQVVPDLLYADGLSGECHGFRYDFLFYHIIYVSGRIGKRSVQMRIRQQVIGAVSIFADTRGIQFILRHSFDAVVQVRNGIVCFLAGPYRKLNGVDPSLLQCAHFAEVPGHTVRCVIGCAGSAFVIFTRGARNPFGLFAACRLDVVIKTSRFAGGNIRANI